ncbi:MAG: hypothetical protein EA348_10150 [Pseudomonadaceae bacterium]|nr:MAG: hypothetical protein EA348_10150 [Pseudomonadaceae bacterium]
MVESGAARARRRDHSIAVTDSSEEEAWLLTYLDVITLILVICVVMLAFAGGQVGPTRWTTDAEAEPVFILPGGEGLLEGKADGVPLDRQEPVAKSEALLAQTEPEPEADIPAPDMGGLDLAGLGKDIDVIMQDSSISFRISSEILFPSGEALLEQAGYEVLDQLIPVLNEVEHRISISGHTDNVPIQTAQFPSNWELSSARAGSVVRYLEANNIAADRLTAIGHGSTQPLEDNNSAAGRAMNRRVELTLELPGSALPPTTENTPDDADS